MNVPIYDVKLKIIVSKKIKNNWDSYVDATKNTIKLYIKKKASPSVIAHEALHIMDEVVIRIYAKHDPKNDEYNAYLIGYLVKVINKKLKNA